MKKSLSAVLIMVFSLLCSATFSTAAARYYHYTYGHYSPWHHYSPSYHYNSHYYYHADSYLPMFGIGVLAGAMASSIIYEPPGYQTIVYKTAPPMVTLKEPPGVNSRVPSTPPPPERILRQVKITEQQVNVRSGPGLDSTVIGQAKAGQTVDVIGAAPEWLYIRTGAGQYGWIMSQYTMELAGPVG